MMLLFSRPICLAEVDRDPPCRFVVLSHQSLRGLEQKVPLVVERSDRAWDLLDTMLRLVQPLVLSRCSSNFADYRGMAVGEGEMCRERLFASHDKVLEVEEDPAEARIHHAKEEDLGVGRNCREEQMVVRTDCLKKNLWKLAGMVVDQMEEHIRRFEAFC